MNPAFCIFAIPLLFRRACERWAPFLSYWPVREDWPFEEMTVRTLWPFELPVEARSDAQTRRLCTQNGQEGMLAGRMIKPLRPASARHLKYLNIQKIKKYFRYFFFQKYFAVHSLFLFSFLVPFLFLFIPGLKCLVCA